MFISSWIDEILGWFFLNVFFEIYIKTAYSLSIIQYNKYNKFFESIDICTNINESYACFIIY